MKVLFWVCVMLIVYTYIGYAIWLKVLTLVQVRPIHRAPILPTVSILIAARNEEATLPAKLENLQRLEYSKQKTQIVIASDGSTDRTETILREASLPLHLVLLQESHGKAHALNEAVKRATGEILIFLDARQTVDPNAISELVSCFADPAVGAVSGELLLERNSSGSSSGLGLYWKIEKMVRKLESASGSVVGVTGAIYAVRRELYPEIPSGTILDDVFVPMHIARSGRRVIFQPSAIARDRLFEEGGKEFSRKVRTLTGNYQLLRLAPWLLSPANPLLFRFVSHKLMRLLVPMLLVMTFVSAATSKEGLYVCAFWLQVVFYLLALLGWLSPPANRFKPVGLATTFVTLNAAAAMALYNFIAGRKRVWV